MLTPEENLNASLTTCLLRGSSLIVSVILIVSGLHIASGLVRGLDLEKLHLESKAGVGRDNSSSTLGAVAIVRGHRERRLLPKAHLDDTFIPALDHFTDANSGNKGLATVNAGVKLLTAICQCTSVVHRDSVTNLWEVDSITSFK